jgi:hypothetical protein
LNFPIDFHVSGEDLAMANVSSAKLLHLPPQQFDLLLQDLESQTPPKTQTMFSLRQVVERLYDFLVKSLGNHYSFDELAVIIHKGLLNLEAVGEVPEIKGETLKKYFLEVRRERESPTGKRKAGTGKSDRTSSVKPSLEARGKGDRQDSESPIVPIANPPIEPVPEVSEEAKPAVKKLPTSRSSTTIELAY